MLRSIRIVCICVLLGSCGNSVKEPREKKEELIMVEPSEMAQLMNEMYAFNESIKQQIHLGKLHNTFPEKFKNINTAILTDPSDRDASFENFSKQFLESEQAIFSADSNDLISRYNTAINACISCHKTTCVGPIPRIKKLLIK